MALLSCRRDVAADATEVPRSISYPETAISAASANLRLCFFSLALGRFSSLLYLAYLIDKYGILYSAFMNR